MSADTAPEIAKLIEAFFQLRPFLTVAHHVPGRIRLRVSLKALTHTKLPDPSGAQELLQSLADITGVRVNRAAGSVVIEYRPATFPPETWDLLLKGDAETARANLLARLAGTQTA